MSNLSIEVSKLLISPYQDRCEPKMSEFLYSNDIYKIPNGVVHSKESGRYIVTKGVSRVKELMDSGEESIFCTVISEVETDEQAFLMRFSEVLDDRIPFHPLEQGLLVASVIEEAIDKDGADKFYSNGGDRRSKESKRESMLDAIGKRMPHKKSTIGVLQRFAKHLTSVGIKGLYRTMMEQGEDISLRKINETNAQLGKRQIRSHINAKMKKLKTAGQSEDEIIDEVGALVHGVFFGDDNENVDASDPEKENEDQDAPDEPDTTEPDFRSVDEKGVVTITESFKIHFADQKNVHDFLENKTALTEQDVSELDKMINDLEDSFSLFVQKFSKLSLNK
jgi:hypothetical protein